MEDTYGFYKLQIDFDETNNQVKNLIYGPNGVMHADYSLLKELNKDYQYPIDGWYWFDSEEQAKIFFNIN